MRQFSSTQDPSAQEAVLKYLDAEYEIVKPGGYVLCAITGEKIELENLKYWNVDRQEAYANAAASMRGHGYAPRNDQS
ncbi:MAG: DUF2093 domain-containing protein [Pseudomonadota bacterium]